MKLYDFYLVRGDLKAFARLSGYSVTRIKRRLAMGLCLRDALVMPRDFEKNDDQENYERKGDRFEKLQARINEMVDQEKITRNGTRHDLGLRLHNGPFTLPSVLPLDELPEHICHSEVVELEAVFDPNWTLNSKYAPDGKSPRELLLSREVSAYLGTDNYGIQSLQLTISGKNLPDMIKVLTTVLPRLSAEFDQNDSDESDRNGLDEYLAGHLVNIVQNRGMKGRFANVPVVAQFDDYTLADWLLKLYADKPQAVAEAVRTLRKWEDDQSGWLLRVLRNRPRLFELHRAVRQELGDA